MDEFEVTPETIELQTEGLVRDLDHINYLIAELNADKLKLEKRLLERFNRVTYCESGNIAEIAHEGQKPHVCGKYKVTIKTDYIYSLNKEEYSIYKHTLPHAFNPVNETIKYEVNKRAFREAQKYASLSEQQMLARFIELKPAKPSIKIEAHL